MRAKLDTFGRFGGICVNLGLEGHSILKLVPSLCDSRAFSCPCLGRNIRPAPIWCPESVLGVLVPNI